MGKVKSYTSASGAKTTHYDENGNKIGETWRSPAGQLTHYDASGNKTGTSFTKSNGYMTHYDSSWNKTGHSRVTNGGRQAQHYDANWNKTGESNKKSFAYETSSAASGAGCATMLLFVAVVYLLVGWLV